MKLDEKIAEQYLRGLSRGAVVYEPITNKPPDFLVDGIIAVEVRRLNQNEITTTGYRGLEETRYALEDQVLGLVKSFGPREAGGSWFFHYHFERPLPKWQTLRPLLRSWLTAFRDQPASSETRKVSVVICEGFELTLFRSSKSFPTFFVPGGCSDGNTGGWVLSEIQKNLQICIHEKTNKVAPFRHKFPEWWLVLIDRIGYGVEECDRELYRSHLRFDHTWNKIVLVNPLNPLSGFEL